MHSFKFFIMLFKKLKCGRFLRHTVERRRTLLV